MKTDALKQYVSLRDSIFAEREQIITRLREIDEALASMGRSGKRLLFGFCIKICHHGMLVLTNLYQVIVIGILPLNIQSGQGTSRISQSRISTTYNANELWPLILSFKTQ